MVSPGDLEGDIDDNLKFNMKLSYSFLVTPCQEEIYLFKWLASQTKPRTAGLLVQVQWNLSIIVTQPLIVDP